MGKKLYLIARVLLGLSFVFFGVTKFMVLDTPVLPQPAMDFLGSMAATGYFIPFVGLAELAVGLMLLFNLWIPLSMMILSPIMINVILFNIFLAPSVSSMIMLLVIVVLQVYIMHRTWHAYKPLLVRKASSR